MPTEQIQNKPDGNTATDILSALPDLGLAGLFLLTWISPYAIDEKMVSYLVLVILMEFIIVHSSAFLGAVVFVPWPKGKKSAALAGLGLFYTMFVAAFSLAFGAWWPLWAFWGMMGNRLFGVLLGQAPQGRERGFLALSWALSVFLYLIAVFAPLMIEPPQFGITSDVVARQGFEIGGEWTAHPEIAIATGFLYFGSLGVFEVFGYRLMRRANVDM